MKLIIQQNNDLIYITITTYDYICICIYHSLQNCSRLPPPRTSVARSTECLGYCPHCLVSNTCLVLPRMKAGLGPQLHCAQIWKRRCSALLDSDETLYHGTGDLAFPSAVLGDATRRAEPSMPCGQTLSCERLHWEGPDR